MYDGQKTELKEKLSLKYHEDKGSYFEIFDDDKLLWSFSLSDVPSLKNYWLERQQVGKEDVLIVQEHYSSCSQSRKIHTCAHDKSELIIHISLENRTVKKYVVQDQKIIECPRFEFISFIKNIFGKNRIQLFQRLPYYYRYQNPFLTYQFGFGVSREQLYFIIRAPSFLRVQPSENEEQICYYYLGVLSENIDENNFLDNTICFFRETPNLFYPQIELKENELKILAKCENRHFDGLTEDEKEELYLSEKSNYEEFKGAWINMNLSVINDIHHELKNDTLMIPLRRSA